MKKLYVITRNDLPISQQATQSIHAAVDLVFKHHIELKNWHDLSNTIVLLSVANEKQLIKLSKKLKTSKIKHTIFTEPDIGDQITALALEPSDDAAGFCKELSTALKPPNKGGLKETEINKLDEQFRELKQMILYK